MRGDVKPKRKRRSFIFLMKSSVIFLLVCHSRGITAEPETVLLRLSDEERHVVYVVICLIEEIIECEVVKEAFRTVHTVSVLIVVGGVVRVGYDYDVVLSGFGAHGVISDYYLPVSAPVVPSYHNRIAVGERLLYKIEGEDIVHIVAAVVC